MKNIRFIFSALSIIILTSIFFTSCQQNHASPTFNGITIKLKVDSTATSKTVPAKYQVIANGGDVYTIQIDSIAGNSERTVGSVNKLFLNDSTKSTNGFKQNPIVKHLFKSGAQQIAVSFNSFKITDPNFSSHQGAYLANIQQFAICSVIRDGRWRGSR